MKFWKKSCKGFTLIEAMMSLVVIGIGIMGLSIISSSTVASNISSHDYTAACDLGEKFLEEIRREALHWNKTGSGDFQEPQKTLTMPLLLALPNGQFGANNFVEATKQFYGKSYSYSRRLVKVDPIFSLTQSARQAKFCVHYRLAWLIQNELIRAEVRVLWYKMKMDVNNPATIYPNCGLNNEANMDANRIDINSITMTEIIRRNVLPQ